MEKKIFLPHTPKKKKHQLQLKIYKLIPKEGNVEKSNCLPYKKAKFLVICESNTHMSPLNV